MIRVNAQTKVVAIALNTLPHELVVELAQAVHQGALTVKLARRALATFVSWMALGSENN